jgi:hypothetical protein
MKHLFPLLFAFLAACASKDDVKNLDQTSIITIQRVEMLEEELAKMRREVDDLQEEQTFQYKDLQFVIPKVRQHDSLILRREFKRDTWGKAGAFAGSLLGLR